MSADLRNSRAASDFGRILYPHNDPFSLVDIKVVEKGEGAHVTDSAGKTYIEGVAGLWCTTLGFSNERLARIAYEQLRTLPFYQASAYKSHPALIALSEKLLGVAPSHMGKAFFANSGSEANESAIKLIWYYNNARNLPLKKKIIGRVNAYHGMTLGASSLTGIAYNHRNFDLPLDRFFHVMTPHHYRNGFPGESEEDFATRCAQELEELILHEGPDTVAAMFMEPVMGAGGVIVPPRTYAEKMQEVLHRYDVLLVADEVICGFGRIGKYWGHDEIGFTPDLISCAKGLSSGYMPIGALIISQEIIDAISHKIHEIGGFGHNFTYSGHPVAAAVALETLKIYEEMDVVDHNRKLGEILQRGLRQSGFSDHPLVGEIRGRGLLAAIELVEDKASRKSFDPHRKIGNRLGDICENNGLILRAMSSDTIAISPPFTVTEEEIRQLLDILECSINQLSGEIANGRI